MANYKDFGFVNTKQLYKDAYDGGYAVAGFNFVTLEQLLAIVYACMETKAPFLLQGSANVRKLITPQMTQRMSQAAIEIMEAEGKVVPMALHLDHGLKYEDCVSCIDSGFSSVMIDGSALPYEENIELTAKVAEYAHKYDVTVEGELGILSGIEEDVVHTESRYTDPAQVEDFVKKTGVDSLAISIGTSHGVAKFKLEPGQTPPPLRFDILEEVQNKLPGFPIVLHGASSILTEYVEMFNKFGGKLQQAQGIPEDQIKKAVQMAVCKINIASDGWIAMTAATRKSLADNPTSIDPRKFLKAARAEMTKVYIRKNTETTLFDK